MLRPSGVALWICFREVIVSDLCQGKAVVFEVSPRFPHLFEESSSKVLQIWPLQFLSKLLQFIIHLSYYSTL
jgi:hypothetical protein